MRASDAFAVPQVRLALQAVPFAIDLLPGVSGEGVKLQVPTEAEGINAHPEATVFDELQLRVAAGLPGQVTKADENDT